MLVVGGSGLPTHTERIVDVQPIQAIDTMLDLADPLVVPPAITYSSRPAKSSATTLRLWQVKWVIINGDTASWASAYPPVLGPCLTS